MNDTDPAWSPDGTKIAFTRCNPLTDPSECIFYGRYVNVMNADGTGQTRVGPSGSELPSWSPDGSKLAFFWKMQYSPSGIWTMNPDGTDWPPSEDGPPAWSPDGTKIAFAAYRNGVNAIYVRNLDGTGETALTNGPTDYDPDWAPAPTHVGPKRSDFQNAAGFCKAERDFLGDAAFTAKYGTNQNGANAYENCVSQNH